jgi:hypothetical protein
MFSHIILQYIISLDSQLLPSNQYITENFTVRCYLTLPTHTLIRTWTVPAAGGDLGMEGTATVDTVMGACPGVSTPISYSRCICNNKCMEEDSVSYIIYNV